jgi:hypothetical protein
MVSASDSFNTGTHIIFVDSKKDGQNFFYYIKIYFAFNTFFQFLFFYSFFKLFIYTIFSYSN